MISSKLTALAFLILGSVSIATAISPVDNALSARDEPCCKRICNPLGPRPICICTSSCGDIADFCDSNCQDLTL
ncbi:hypothetical protein HGRIS_008729 [Hohenbuehelia grisea]|uniref:Uncharacterized protein n=1 Tax=Hohenbuehelia grisea TaxID=104357 RepID=A0ABR3J8T8_9AGAR